MLIDMHVHSSHTEGCEISIEDLIAAVAKAGLDGFLLTDMHTVEGGPEAKRLASEAGLLALVGFEADTDRGHYLVVVPDPESLPPVADWISKDEKGRFVYKALAKAVEGKKGILIAAHPYDRDIEAAPGDALIQLAGISALEVANSRRSQLANDLAEEAAAGLGLPGVAGSDARLGTKDIGQLACLVEGSITSEAELIERIRACDIWPVGIGLPDRPERRPRGRDDRGGRSGGRPPRGRSDSRGRGRDGGRGRGRDGGGGRGRDGGGGRGRDGARGRGGEGGRGRGQGGGRGGERKPASADRGKPEGSKDS